MSWTAIKDLKEKRAGVFAQANALREKARKETRDLSAEEVIQHDAFLADVEKLGTDLAREERAYTIGQALGATSAVGRDDSEQGNSVGMPEKDLSKYSLLRAIQARINNRSLDGVEAEVSKEIERRSGKAPQGFYFPTEIAVNKRTLLNTTTGTGAVGTVTAPTFIEVLRNRMITQALGASMLPNMVGNFSLPQQTASGTAYWVAEGNAPTTSNQTVGQVAFSPKTVGAYTDLSRKFINQSSFDAENFVRDDLAKVLGIELDRAGMLGSGNSNQPLGIVPNLVANFAGQILALGADGEGITFADCVALETLVATANADSGSLAYATNAKVRGALKVTPKSSVAATVGFVWESGDTVNGYRAAVSNSITGNATKGGGTNLSTMIFGDWSSLTYALWGGLDILVDPYTGSNAGTVRVVALQDVDVNVRHGESFSAVKDIDTTDHGPFGSDAA